MSKDEFLDIASECARDLIGKFDDSHKETQNVVKVLLGQYLINLMTRLGEEE